MFFPFQRKFNSVPGTETAATIRWLPREAGCGRRGYLARQVKRSGGVHKPQQRCVRSACAAAGFSVPAARPPVVRLSPGRRQPPPGDADRVSPRKEGRGSEEQGCQMAKVEIGELRPHTLHPGTVLNQSRFRDSHQIIQI